MIWEQGEFFLDGGGYSLAMGSKATALFVAHESVSANFIMVALAATEGAGGVGPGAIFVTMASSSTSKAFPSHCFDKVFIRASVGSSGTGTGGVDLHSHGVDWGGSGLRAGCGSPSTAISNRVVPSTCQVDELLEGLGFLGELGYAQPLMDCISQPVLESVLEVAVRPLGSSSDLLEVGCILCHRFASLTELDQLFLGLGDIVTSLESSIKSFNESCPYGREWEGGVGVQVVRFNRLEIGDSP